MFYNALVSRTINGNCSYENTAFFQCFCKGPTGRRFINRLIIRLLNHFNFPFIILTMKPGNSE